MNERDKVVLKKILKYCLEAEEACIHFGGDFDMFKENSIFLNACSMCILQIGELCKVLSSEAKEIEKSVPWRAWCGIRDVFAHQYSNVDCEIVWQTIKNDLPKLKSSVKKLRANVIPSLSRNLILKKMLEKK